MQVRRAIVTQSNHRIPRKHGINRQSNDAAFEQFTERKSHVIERYYVPNTWLFVQDGLNFDQGSASAQLTLAADTVQKFLLPNKAFAVVQR